MSEAAFYDFFRKIQLRSDDGITLRAELEADSVKDILTIQESPGVTLIGNEANDSFKINVDYDLYSPLGATAIRLQDVNNNTKDINFTAGTNMIITRLADDEIKFISTSTGDTAEIQNITQTNPVVITTTEIHGFAKHISIIPVEIQGMTELNGNQYFVDIVSDTEIALYSDPNLTTPIDGTLFTAYVDSGLVIADRVLDSLDQLKDTDIVNPYDDQVLKYDGTKWVPEILDPDPLGGNRVFVSAEKGNDTNDGITYPVASIKRACEIASSMIYDVTGNVVRSITIIVATGDYVEQNPIIVPDNVSIIGDNLRRVIVRPGNVKQDIFRVRNGSYINGLTFRDAVDANGVPVDTFRYAISFDNVLDTSVSRVAYTNMPSTRPRIFLSPYMQNCSLISFLGGNGVEIDGNLIDTPNTPLNSIEAENPVNLLDGIPEQGKSMVANALTILSFGGNAWRVINDAYAQIVSCFVIFTENGCLTQNGGYLSITNSASNFGLFALRSTGYSPTSFEFDRGWVSSNGINDGLQTLTAIGLKRSAIEHFVIRIRNIANSDITDNFNSNSTLGIEATLTPSVANVGSNTVTFPSPHGFENGNEVEYDANGNLEIIGLLNETTYFISAVNVNTIALYHDFAQTKPVRDLDASVATGSHIFRAKFEEFFVNDIVETHNIYQDLQLPIGTYSIAIGDRILGTNGASVVNADIADWDPTTRILTVSINKVQVGNDQIRNQFASGATINAGGIAIGAVTITTATIRNDLYTSEFTLLSSVNGRAMQNIASAVQQRINLHRPSICNSSSHTWEYSGSGIDYNALPQNGGTTDEFFEQVSTKPGRVYSSGTNEIGDFKVGDFVRAFNRTGNINFKNKVSIGELDSLALSLSSGVVVNEISTDIELGDNEVDGAKHTRLVTQLAIRSFLDNRLGNFIDKQLSTNAIPSAVVQLNSSGQINLELIPPQGNFSSYTVNSFEGRTELHLNIPANDLIPGDIVIEEYQETVLTLTGSITVVNGETITQANSGATGVTKSNYIGIDLRLVTPVGTFNTTDQLTGSVSGALGVNSVPLSVSGPNNIVDNYFLKKSRQSQFLILDNTQSYDFTDIILNQTALKGAVSGAIITVDAHVIGVLTGVDFLSLPNGAGYTTSGTYRNVAIVAVTGSGTGALVDVTVNSGGQITSFDIKRGGSGYADGDTVRINDAAVGGRAGGTQFEISVTEIENRLYVTLNQDAGLEFNANSVNLDFIVDDNVIPFTIANQTATTQLTFNAQDIGSSGSVDSINDRIVFGSAHGYTNGDPVEYDSNSNVALGGLSNNSFYYVKVINATTIELYNDYSLAPANLVNILSTGTGTHILRIHAVSVDEDRFYVQGHGLSTGDAIRIDATDPSAPINDEDYLFVGGVTTNSFTLHRARGAALDSVNGLIVAAIDVTDTGTGSVIIEQQNVIITGDVNTSGQDLNNWSSLSTSTVDAQNIVSGIIGPIRLGTGSANDSTFLRGDSQYVFAVQGITNTTIDDPITLTGSSYYDGVKDIYYDVVDLRVELAGFDNPVAPSSGTERAGVAAFDFDHFVIDANGKVTTKSTALGGVIDADTLDSQQGSYYTNPINLSRPVPVEKGGTNIAAMTAGDLLYAATNIGDGNFDDAMSTLTIGNNNDVLVVSSGLPGWSNVLTLESVTVDNIRIAVTGDNEIDTISGNLTIDSAGGTVIVDDNLTVAGNLTVDTNTLYVDSLNNRVGIGTLSPATKLDLLGDGLILRARSTTSTSAYSRYDATTGLLAVGVIGGTGYIGTTDATALRLVTDSIERMRINSAGDVVVNNITINTNTISTLSGNLIIDSASNAVTIDSDLTVAGNLTVSGTTTTVNTETVTIADNVIVLNSNETGTPSQNSGIEVERGTATNVVLQWNETTDYWEIASGGIIGRILTTGDEGEGNGLDADTVDGQHGSYYLDWTNTTNKPDPQITVELTGDVTGSGNTTLTDLANGTVSFATTVADDSHTHDTQYYTETEIDTKLTNGTVTKLANQWSNATGNLTGFVNDGGGNVGLRFNATPSGTNTLVENGIAFEIEVDNDISTGDFRINQGSSATGLATETITWTTAFTIDSSASQLLAYGSRILTVADEGTGNGLDADTVDGVQGSEIWRKGTDIPGSADLNTYTIDGYYHQNTNANAASGTNYPVAIAGMLEVLSDGIMVYQIYQSYDNTGGMYRRSYYNGTWFSWKRLLDNGGNVTITSNLAINGGDLTTTAATFNLLNTTATTLNIGGAATALNLGATTGIVTLANNLTVNGNTTLGDAATDTVTVTGDLAVNGGDLTTTAATFNLLNATATTLNIGGAATALNLGATTGTTTVRNNLTVNGNTTLGDAATDTVTVTGDLAINGGDLTTTAATFNLLNTTATTLNIGGAATALNLGAITSTITVAGDLVVNGGDLTTTAATFNLANTTATTLNIGGAATVLTIGATTGSVTLANDLTVNGNTTLGNATTDTVTVTGDLAINGGDLTTTATAFNLVNTVATTVNAFGAATTLNLGATTGNVTVAGDLVVNGGDITTTATTFNLLDTIATTLNIGGAATVLFLGSGLGTTNVRNSLTVNGNTTLGNATTDTVTTFGDLAVNGDDLTTTATTFNLINTAATTLNIGGAATALNLGAASGTITIANNLTVNGNTTLGNAGTDTVTVAGNLTMSGNILPNTPNTRDIGTALNKFSTVHATLFSGTALEAYYADLAENYVADKPYEPGTVVVFGGSNEVTVTDQFQDYTVAGVISTNPAYLMNSHQEGDIVVAVALQGRVPCKVIGPVRKGQMLVTSSTPGYAEAALSPGVGTVIGKSLVNKTSDHAEVIEIVVGKH